MQKLAHHLCEQKHVLLYEKTKSMYGRKNINFAHPINNINPVSVISRLSSLRPYHFGYRSVFTLYGKHTAITVKNNVNLEGVIFEG